MKSSCRTWRRSLFAVALLAGAIGIAARRAPAGHVNKVTPEAKAALDKYAQIVYRPAEHGLKLATGKIAVDGDNPRPSIKFSFSPERKVKVEWTDAGKARKLPEPVLGMVDMVLEGAYLGVPIPDKTEYDAELFHGPSGDELKISCFTDSVVKSQLRVSLDEHGLARTVVMSVPPPADHNQPAPTPVTLVLGWGKTDEGYRIEQISFPGIGATAFGGMKVAIGYQALGKYQIATAWTIEAKIGSDMRVMNFRAGDLQLDGRPIALGGDGKPAAGAGK